MKKPLLLVCSVDLELDPLLRYIEEPQRVPAGRRSAIAGAIAGQPIVAVAAGMGKTNGGHALTALLEKLEVGAVIGFGVAGAYPGSGLSVGQLAVAEAETYGDEGVATPSGWISCGQIGIPLVGSGTDGLFNELPCDQALRGQMEQTLAAAGLPVLVGRFVTVSCCSGTAERGSEIAARFDAICETMEGAAWAHVAALYELPYGELRGISNLVEDRNLASWRLRDAAEAAGSGVATIARGIADAPPAEIQDGRIVQ